VAKRPLGFDANDSEKYLDLCNMSSLLFIGMTGLNTGQHI